MENWWKIGQDTRAQIGRSITITTHTYTQLTLFIRTMPVLQKIKSLVHKDKKSVHHENEQQPIQPLTHELEAEQLSREGDLFTPVMKTVEAEPVFLRRETTAEAATVLPVREVEATILSKEPTTYEKVEKPTVIVEHIHPVEKEEIQPVIYREREQLDVMQVTQLLHETEIRPTIVERRELAPKVRAPVVEKATIEENVILPSIQRDATLRTQHVHEPIVNEIIKKTVIEEITPVLNREIISPTVLQQTQPIYEKIIEAPVVVREVRQVKDLGVRYEGGSCPDFIQLGSTAGRSLVMAEPSL
ncbi:Liver stage antigen 3 precursor [Planoprotostelium fungivorum]|uniref:Liver stage antigen 3 n=1 Tax=Planoprotostelium fungivorum TaxID=1890364 RepID=A0A2P6N7V1_9EUKA|nr:Liver stage antigen 3 precursor [Planoprotostelium fungivorum]